jgi:hypothetical protein
VREEKGSSHWPFASFRCHAAIRSLSEQGKELRSDTTARDVSLALVACWLPSKCPPHSPCRSARRLPSNGWRNEKRLEYRSRHGRTGIRGLSGTGVVHCESAREPRARAAFDLRCAEIDETHQRRPPSKKPFDHTSMRLGSISTKLIGTSRKRSLIFLSSRSAAIGFSG